MNSSSQIAPSQWDTFRVKDFDDLPDHLRRRVFKVDYIQLDDSSGGRMWLTRFGWQRREFVHPSQWFEGRRYARNGERLPGGTGHVYRVPTWNRLCRRMDLVVKFSRFAQDVPLMVTSEFPVDISDEAVAQARFNDPFQEFGLLMELRRGHYGPQDLRILTKRPLAIYSPGRTYRSWQLGRIGSRFKSSLRDLLRDQEALLDRGEPVEINIDRQYIIIFEWVKGENAEDFYKQGLLTEKELHELTARVVNELDAKGFLVLDNKPRHFILRRRHDGSLLRRDGKLVYALIDFELLQRNEPYREYIDSLKQKLKNKTAQP